METVLSELDRVLIDVGRYHSKKDLIEDALRALLRAKPELKREAALELYGKRAISLSRAAELCGVTLEDFKELLKERGIKIPVPSIPAEEVDDEVARILG
jgi:predicted HTH domain antitoxin